eukprot:134054-Chlamydomonas_euryale.AAC.2
MSRGHVCRCGVGEGVGVRVWYEPWPCVSSAKRQRRGRRRGESFPAGGLSQHGVLASRSAACASAPAASSPSARRRRKEAGERTNCDRVVSGCA